MDFVVPIAGVAGMAFIGLVVFVVLRPSMQRASQRTSQRNLHNAALTELGTELGLEIAPAAQELVQMRVPLGRIQGGIVPLPATDRVRVEAGLLTRGRLCLRKRGSNVSGAKTGQPTPTGDAAFDQEIEVLGASAALRAALREPALKALIRRVIIDEGGVAVHNGVVIDRRLPSSTAELRASLQMVVTLARWLNEPNAAPEYHVAAPLVPPYQRVAESQRARAFLEAVGPSLGAGKTLEREDGLEWRGSLDGTPLRIVVDGEDIRVQMNASLPVSNIELYWQPDEVPEPQGDVWDEDEDEVFVGHGVTISRSYEFGESPEKAFQQRCADWARLPEATQADIVATMSGCDVHELTIGPGGIKAKLRRGVGEMLHPQTQIQALARGLARTLVSLASLPPPESAVAAPQIKVTQVHRDKCAYCRSVFVWTTKAVCPNCGAPVGQ